MSNIKLHEVIERVLTNSNTPLSCIEIAKNINSGYMYRRRDGRKVPSSQILANVKNYNSLFNIADGIISLKLN